MRLTTVTAALLLGVALLASPSSAADPEHRSAPLLLDPATLDRVTAGASAAAQLGVGNAPGPMVVTDPPRRLRDLLPWLRRKIGCALPGRVCTQG